LVAENLELSAKGTYVPKYYLYYYCQKKAIRAICASVMAIPIILKNHFLNCGMWVEATAYRED
jgi:hypothetical protein